jgi:hypothetical protein
MSSQFVWVATTFRHFWAASARNLRAKFATDPRREQKRTLFTLPELLVFDGVVVGALAGLYALISGRISIWPRNPRSLRCPSILQAEELAMLNPGQKNVRCS